MAASDQLNKYKTIWDQYTQKSGSQNDFAKTLEQQINERANYNKDLIEQKNTAQQEYYNLPAQLRAQYASSAVRNPLQAESLIAQRRGQTGALLGTTTDLLNARKQKFQDILNSAIQSRQGDIENTRLSAEGAWRLYQDELAREEQEKARRAAAAQAAMMAGLYGGGGSSSAPTQSVPVTPGTTYTPDTAGYDTGTKLVAPWLINPGKGGGVNYDMVQQLISQSGVKPEIPYSSKQALEDALRAALSKKK